MFNVQRVTDTNIKGGIIVSSLQTNVFANYLPVAVTGSIVAPYIDNKFGSVTGLGSLTVRANYLPVNRQFDRDLSGDIRLGGSFDVKAG